MASMSMRPRRSLKRCGQSPPGLWPTTSGPHTPAYSRRPCLWFAPADRTASGSGREVRPTAGAVIWHPPRATPRPLHPMRAHGSNQRRRERREMTGWWRRSGGFASLQPQQHGLEMLRGLRIIMSRRDDALHRLHRGGRWGRQRRKESGGGTCGGPNSIGSDGRLAPGGAAKMGAAKGCTARVAAPVRVGVGESTGRGIMP